MKLHHVVPGRLVALTGPGLSAVSAAEHTALSALASMAAAASGRGQVEVFMALQRAGLTMTSAEARAIVRNLEAAGLLAQIIELDDGGVLATLTPIALAELNTHWRHFRAPP